MYSEKQSQQRTVTFFIFFLIRSGEIKSHRNKLFFLQDFSEQLGNCFIPCCRSCCYIFAVYRRLPLSRLFRLYRRNWGIMRKKKIYLSAVLLQFRRETQNTVVVIRRWQKFCLAKPIFCCPRQPQRWRRGRRWLSCCSFRRDLIEQTGYSYVWWSLLEIKRPTN